MQEHENVKVLISLPVKNEEKTLLKCLDSLVNQSMKCLILVSDNYSTDESPKIIKKYVELFPNIKYVNPPNPLKINEHACWLENYIKDNYKNIKHYDMAENVVKIAGVEFYSQTDFFPDMETQFKRINSFKYEFIEKFKYLFSNPPYGGDKNTKTAEDIKRDKLIAYLRNLKDDMTDVLKEQLSRLLKEKKEEEIGRAHV